MTKGGPVEVTSRDGMEWRQNEQVIIAKGDAKAVRGDVTVTADQLIAHYRKKAAAPGAAPAVATPAAASADAKAKQTGTDPTSSDTGDNEVYRLEAVGNVHIFTPTDQAWGDHAVYDIDQAVLIMTGKNLRIITPQQTMSARDAMEYWSQKHMSVGRGNAVVNTSDGRRLTGDILVGYTVDPNAPPGAAPAKPAAPAPGDQGAAAKAAKPGSDPLASEGGKLQRVDAFGHVVVLTATEIIHADKGVYVPDTGIARLAGNVRMTRGLNELNGDEALINLRTGVSTMVRMPGQRVQGLVVPNEATTNTPGASAAAKPAKPGGALK